MKDEDKTKAQLIEELESLRQQVTERKQQEQERATLLQLSQTLLATLDPQAVMEQAAETISQVLGEERALVLLLPHEKSRKMVVCYARGWTGNVLGLEVSLERWQESSTAHTLQQQKPLLINEVATEGGFHFHPAATTEEVHSVVAVPMVAEGKPLGALVACSLKPFRFSVADVHLFSLIANQTAMALERAQLHQMLQAFSKGLEKGVEEKTRELRQAQDELVRKERLVILGQLASSIAHELRQPLFVMNNAVYYLRMKLPEVNPDIKEYLGILETEVKVAERIVRGLLDSGRLRPSQKQAVAVRELVADQIARLSLPSTVAVQQHFPSKLPLVYVDPVRIGQVINNLLRNALEAMGEKGGTLTLTGAQTEKDQVTLAVTDTGEGIPEENLQKIFEPFFTTKARGIGLGLSISRGLVQADGGKLWVWSRVGKGTTFALVLPVVGEKP